MADVGVGSPASPIGTPAPQAGGQADRGLRSGALKAGDVVVLALASSGPTQSIAVSLAALLVAVAYASFLPLLICFIPMLGIAIGYQRLNAWQPSAGATYSWVGRALNPHAGFFAGWIMLMYYVIGTTSLTIPLGTYLLSFFSNAAASNTVDVALVGTVFDLIVLAVAALGIKLSARFQWGWAIFEYGLLVGFTIAALVTIYGGHQPGAVHISGSWFTLHGAGGFSALISGILIAIFLYSGWDTAAYVGEEAHGKKAGPAAITSVVLLFVMYSVVILAFQGIAPNSRIQADAGNVLAYVGQLIGGGFWSNVMIVAVLGGTLASLQAAIVSASRIGYAMGRDRVFPAWFGTIHARHQTPWNATILFGLLNVVFLWAATLIGSIGTALSDIVSSLGLMAAMFYLLTAGTAVWYYRKSITASGSNFVLGGVLPGVGAAFMAFVIVYSLASGALNGIQIIFGFGFAVIGLVLSFAARRMSGSAFYTDRSARGGSDPAAPGTSAAVPESAAT
ncbi:MAG TPA: APC family permease [Streptosporangiaceae bacterium]